ncbi:MAG: XF1762 family protein [Vicinamibacterales bacterium]
MKPRIEIVPCERDEANAFVEQVHRHHGPVVGHKFALAAVADWPEMPTGGVIVGVAIVGRPVARHLDDGWTLEVTRLATDGTANAASALYGACRRAAFALGYRRLITYTLATEPGASLRGAGWKVVGEVRGRSWSCQSRPRVDKHPLQRKLRWEVTA